MSDPIETVVRRVAEALGWDKYHFAADRLPSYRPDPSVVGAYYKPDGHQLIILAAYAKAECAKRGYIPVRFEHPDRLSMRHRDHMGKTDPNLYDPEDPVSESEAILRAADDVVGNKDCRG